MKILSLVLILGFANSAFAAPSGAQQKAAPARPDASKRVERQQDPYGASKPVINDQLLPKYNDSLRRPLPRPRKDNAGPTIL